MTSGNDVQALPIATLRELSAVDTLRGISRVLCEWAVIAGAIAVCDAAWHPVLYVLAVVTIGSRQHALLVLAHEGAHGLLAPNRRTNDFVSEALVAWPILIAFRSYRAVHRLHHRHLNTELDPDWARNRPDRLAACRGWSGFLRILLGLEGRQQRLGDWVFRGALKHGTSEAESRWRLAYYVLVVVAILGAGGLRLLAAYWLVPWCTWFLLTVRLKGTAEHFAVESDDALNASRSVRASLLERLLVAPLHAGHHVEHHMYPSVPYYRLPRLRAELMKTTAFRSRHHATRGYWGFLREAAAATGLVAAVPRTFLEET